MQKLFAVALVLIGCGGGGKTKTKADLEAEYGAKLKPRLEAIVEAGKVADGARSQLGKPGGPPDDVDVDYNDDAHTGNAVIAQFDDLASATSDASAAFRFAELDNDEVRIAKAFVGAPVGLSSGNWGASFEDEIKHVLDAKYLLVVFPTKLASPSVGLGGTEFTPGKAAATVILVEIESKKVHGGFEVTATNSDQVMVKRTSGTSAADDKVESDLKAQLGKAISTGIRDRWKNAKAPYNWGYGW